MIKSEAQALVCRVLLALCWQPNTAQHLQLSKRKDKMCRISKALAAVVRMFELHLKTWIELSVIKSVIFFLSLFLFAQPTP